MSGAYSHRPRRYLRNPSFLLGAILTAIFVGLALVSLFWTPADIARLNVSARLLPPSPQNWF
jgi:peptide/nickel transport system permease protein